jgi:hypothetical protein
VGKQRDKILAILTGKVTDEDISELRTVDGYAFWVSLAHAGNMIVNTPLSAELVFHWLEQIPKFWPIEDHHVIRLGRKFPGCAGRYLDIVRERKIPVSAGCIKWLRKDIQAKRCVMDIVTRGGDAESVQELFLCLTPDATREEFQYICGRLPEKRGFVRSKKFPYGLISFLPEVCYPWIEADIRGDIDVVLAIINSKAPGHDETKAKALISWIEDPRGPYQCELQAPFVIPDSVVAYDFLKLLSALSLLTAGKHHIKNLPQKKEVAVRMLQVLLSKEEKMLGEVMEETHKVRDELARAIGRAKSARKTFLFDKKLAPMKKAA